MVAVMMRCPTTGDDFDTGLAVPRKSGVKSIGLATVHCPFCKHHHYIRRAFFKGDTPPTYFPTDGLEAAPAFAMEIGTIIGATSFMDAYIPQIYAKVSGSAVEVAVFGAFSSISQKIAVLDVLRYLNSHVPEVSQDLSIVIEKFRKCSSIRDFYAHAKYNYGPNSPNQIGIIPYFGDSRKRSDGITISIEKIRDDADFIWQTKMMVREYIAGRARPKR